MLSELGCLRLCGRISTFLLPGARALRTAMLLWPSFFYSLAEGALHRHDSTRVNGLSCSHMGM